MKITLTLTKAEAAAYLAAKEGPRLAHGVRRSKPLASIDQKIRDALASALKETP